MKVRTPEYSLQLWDSLAEYCRTHWDKPDLFPLRIALAQYAIHWKIDVPPVWSFILGPSGSAKSSMVIQALRQLDMVYPIDIITKNTFVSGLGKEYGILMQLPQLNDGSNRRTGILVFSDFSTFLEMEQKERRTIQSIMRVLYDGFTTKMPGNLKIDEIPDWEGKVTVIAACTNSIQHYWSLANELGERFVSCSLVERSKQDVKAILKQAVGQLNNGSWQSRQTYATLVRKFVDRESLYDIHFTGDDQLEDISMLVASARRSIRRTGYKITGVGDEEYPTRLIKELGAVAMGNAALMRRMETNTTDLSFAKMVGISTIPRNRLIVLYNLWYWRCQGYIAVPTNAITEAHRGVTMLDIAVEDLTALGIVCEQSEGILALTEMGFEMLAKAELSRWIQHPTDF